MAESFQENRHVKMHDPFFVTRDRVATFANRVDQIGKVLGQPKLARSQTASGLVQVSVFRESTKLIDRFAATLLGHLFPVAHDRATDLYLSDRNTGLADSRQDIGLRFHHHGRVTDVMADAEVAAMMGLGKVAVEPVDHILGGVEDAPRFRFDGDNDSAPGT